MDNRDIDEIRARWAKATHPLGAPGSIARQAEDDFRVVFAAIEERDAEISQLRERVEEVQRERDEALERAERIQSEMAAALELATRQRDAAERSCAEAIERRERFEAALLEERARIAAAREALGEGWFAGGVDLAEAIRRKTTALEELVHSLGAELDGKRVTPEEIAAAKASAAEEVLDG